MTTEERIHNLAQLADAADDCLSKYSSRYLKDFFLKHPRCIMFMKYAMDAMEKMNEEDRERMKISINEFSESYEVAKIEREQKYTTPEVQQEIADCLDMATNIFYHELKISSKFSSDPVKRAQAEAAEAVRDMRHIFMNSMLTSIAPIGSAFKKAEELRGYSKANLVKIRPCGEEFQGKTYLGIYLGDFPLGFQLYHDKDDKRLLHVEPTFNNPAIYIPSLHLTVFGCESWWGEIETEEDFKKITDEDINSTWYVDLLKKMNDDNKK